MYALAQGVADLQAEVRGSSVLPPATQARDERRLDALAGQLPRIESLQRQIAAQTDLLRTLDDQRAVAQAGVDHFQGVVRDDLRQLSSALGANTAAVSTTVASVAVTATVAISAARLDLQLHAARLALDVQAGVQLLPLLSLNTRARVDTRRLAARLNALARQVHLGITAVMSDLTLVARSDPSAASDAQGGLAAGLATALTTLSDSLTGAIDARQSALRLSNARLQGQITRLLGTAAVTLAALGRDVLAGEVAAAPLKAADQQHIMAALPQASDATSNAATVSAQLAGRLADLGVAQDAQARIDREVQKAQADLDAIMARSDAALQGRLRSDVTVSIKSAEQTIHVRLNTLDVGALVRDLDFNVRMGLSVLQIAALHAEVTPSTRNLTGSPRTTIQGVDLLLQARLQGLQARIRTDVTAVRQQQAQESSAVRARVASLRTTLSGVLAPLVARYQADINRLQAALDASLGRANTGLHAARVRLAAMASLESLEGHIIAGLSRVPLYEAPATNSTVAAYEGRDDGIPLVGYVWGWSVRRPGTGAWDGRWYALRDPVDATRYLYVPAVFLTVAPIHG